MPSIRFSVPHCGKSFRLLHHPACNESHNPRPIYHSTLTQEVDVIDGPISSAINKFSEDWGGLNWVLSGRRLACTTVEMALKTRDNLSRRCVATFWKKQNQGPNRSSLLVMAPPAQNIWCLSGQIDYPQHQTRIHRPRNALALKTPLHPRRQPARDTIATSATPPLAATY
jgi:hypothetical protein